MAAKNAEEGREGGDAVELSHHEELVTKAESSESMKFGGKEFTVEALQGTLSEFN